MSPSSVLLIWSLKSGSGKTPRVSMPDHFPDPFGRRSLPRVSVLAGGDSPERDISLASGHAVATALRELGEEVREIDPTEVPVSECDWMAGDVVLLALHGPGGEDGTVQAVLDSLGVPYTGCGVEASRLAFSKSRAKRCFESAGVPTPDAVVLKRGFDARAVAGLVSRCGSPVVVKPDAQGSSLGVRLVETPGEFSAAVTRAFSLGSRVLVERAVAGEEWSVGMLDGWPLPAMAIQTPCELFDFEAKYLDERTKVSFPEMVPGSTAERVVEVSRRACEAIETRGLVRVDLRVDASGGPWVLEINTIPGLTGHSLVPQAAARVGLSLGQLARRMIASTLAGPRGWHIRQDQMPRHRELSVS